MKMDIDMDIDTDMGTDMDKDTGMDTVHQGYWVLVPTYDHGQFPVKQSYEQEQ